MSNTLTIYNFIKTAIKEITEGENPVITMQSNLVYDLKFDSLDTIKLIVLVEDHFKIKVNDHFIEHLDTVEAIVKLTESLIEKTQQNENGN